MPQRRGPSYFTDENAMGMGKLLTRSGRDDVVYPGHDRLPQVPRGTADLEWMPVVAALDIVVITRDRRLRTRPVELRSYIENGVKSVWLGGRHDLGPQQQAELFLRHEERLRREIIKLGPGPWALALTPAGLRPLRLRGS